MLFIANIPLSLIDYPLFQIELVQVLRAFRKCAMQLVSDIFRISVYDVERYSISNRGEIRI